MYKMARYVITEKVLEIIVKEHVIFTFLKLFETPSDFTLCISKLKIKFRALYGGEWCLSLSCLTERIAHRLRTIPLSIMDCWLLFRAECVGGLSTLLLQFSILLMQKFSPGVFQRPIR